LSDGKVRDVSAAECPEPPLVWRGQNAELASCEPVCRQAWPHDNPVESGRLDNPTRTLWPAWTAALTASSPLPQLAPMTRTFAVGSYPF